jgi:hypothetical protein
LASRLASLFSYPFIPAAVNVRPGLGDAHLKHASRLAKLDLPHLTHVQSALLGLALESSAAAVAPGPAPAFVSLLRAAFATARRIAGGVYLPPALVPMPFRMGVFDVPAVGATVHRRRRAFVARRVPYDGQEVPTQGVA